MQGSSLLPVTRGQTDHLPAESYIQFGDGFLPPGRALRTSRWKYSVLASTNQKGKPTARTYNEQALYDLQTDPYELTNLVEFPSHLQIREELQQRLLDRIKAAGEPKARIRARPKGKGNSQRLVEYPNQHS